MTVTGEFGTSAAEAISAEVEELGKEVTREAMTVWHTAAQERLMNAAGQRSGIDSKRDTRGELQGRKENDLHELADQFTPIVWSEKEQAWQFACAHVAAAFHEWGAKPHEIKAKQAQVLAFEWPDAPEEVEKQFEDTFPTVFFASVDHPGVPAIGFMRYGREQARKRLRDAGFSTSGFEGSDGGAE